MVGETSDGIWRPRNRRDSSHPTNEDPFVGAPVRFAQNDASGVEAEMRVSPLRAFGAPVEMTNCLK